MSGIFPNPGDVVTFPAAPRVSNRNRRYVVTQWMGNLLAFTEEGDGRGIEFQHHICDLWQAGLTIASPAAAKVA